MLHQICVWHNPNIQQSSDPLVHSLWHDILGIYCNTDAGIILEKRSWMRIIPVFLAFIQDNLLIPVHESSPVYSHVTICFRQVYHHDSQEPISHLPRSFRLIEIVIHDSKVSFCRTDSPVCYVLPYNSKTVSLKLLF